MTRSTLRFLGFIFLFTVLLSFISHTATAQPTSYKKIGKGSSASIVLANCPLVDGVTKVKITDGGKSIFLHTKKNRDEYDLEKKYKFFACDAGIIYAKTTETGVPVTFDLSDSDFPKSENNVGSVCPNVQSWPGTLIYKIVGSDHFKGDPRRNAVNVIAKFGYRGGGDSCIDVYATNGTKLGQMGDYGQGWVGGPFRWYGPTGPCGNLSVSGATLSKMARDATDGNPNIFVKIGNTCYGPINAGVCIGSKGC